jgi:hypothetical protein
MKIILMLALVVFLVFIGPVATIWALNTLFPILAIPLTFETWCAALILGGVASGGLFRSSK